MPNFIPVAEIVESPRVGEVVGYHDVFRNFQFLEHTHGRRHVFGILIAHIRRHGFGQGRAVARGC
jgi:hypothetical protein